MYGGSQALDFMTTSSYQIRFVHVSGSRIKFVYVSSQESPWVGTRQTQVPLFPSMGNPRNLTPEPEGLGDTASTVTGTRVVVCCTVHGRGYAPHLEVDGRLANLTPQLCYAIL